MEILTVAVITGLSVWPAVIVQGCFAAIAAVAAVPEYRNRMPSPAALLTLLVLPLPLVIWAGLNWAVEEALPATGTHWRGAVEAGLALLAVAIGVVVLLVSRRAPKFWLIVASFVASMVLVAAAWFVGSMAITNAL